LRGARRSVALLAGVAAAACAGPAEVAPVTLSDGRYAMGTVLEVTLVGSDADALARARDALFARVAELDALLSSHDEASDVSRLNRAAGRGPIDVDPVVADVLRDSIALSGLTRGSFDVTVGPLVALWTRAGERGVLPTPAALARARDRVGPERVTIDAEGKVALAAGTALNLGGVAKGFALDRVRPLLRSHGVSAALLNFGQSSTWAVGAPPDGPGWRLLARAPAGGFAGVLSLRDRALSVSGSLGQSTEIEGRRYGHVLDPRSGEPLMRPREALVVAPSATLAEALSKALLVLGEVEGLALVAAQAECEGLLLDADGRRFATPGWREATGFESI
jgi:thiamine biosynthesis lipoprotein